MTDAEVILDSPEKKSLVEAIEKIKAIHKELRSIDNRLTQWGVLVPTCHDEMRYEFSEDDDESAQLFAKRVQLVKDLEALSNDLQDLRLIPATVDVGPGDGW